MSIEEYKYCSSLTSLSRLITQPVKIGHVTMGGNHPVVIQSMANVSTTNTKASIEQAKRIIDAGGEMVRFTTQGILEAKNLSSIRAGMKELGYKAPLVADVHFNPAVSIEAAKQVEKVRINPGNFISNKIDCSKRLKETSQKLEPLLEICISLNRALRIGVNHGSLSPCIMNKFGDTPEGMVESALEYLKICNQQKFSSLIISMKSSNTRVMVYANRLLAHKMIEEDLLYPVHLGVTEAGDGEDGRIKSSVGIGALLADGIGDTIRVSLTEPPENEIPVAKKIIDHIDSKYDHPEIKEINRPVAFNPFHYNRRKTNSVRNIGRQNVPVVLMSSICVENFTARDKFENYPDFLLVKDDSGFHQNLPFSLIIPSAGWTPKHPDNIYPLFNSPSHFLTTPAQHPELNFISIKASDLENQDLKELKNQQVVLILSSDNNNSMAEQRRFIFELMALQLEIPVIIHKSYTESELEQFQIKSSVDTGILFLDGLANGLFLENKGYIPPASVCNTAYGILQSTRSRMIKTEYISCPGCGRTLFDLEETTRKIKEKTAHLKKLKIGIMGCIVNGPGEMADADYGYVGAKKGKITLYKGKTPVKKNIPQEYAVKELLELIKKNNDWEE